MTEHRVPTTTKVEGLIAAHTDLLEQHGISGGLAADRPEPGAEGCYYFSTDTGVWARDNGVSWDEVFGFTEEYIQALIDTSLSTHTSNEAAHHSRYTDDEAVAAVHPAPAYDSEEDEVVFTI
ncbi:unnamed protein product [marine sediment metagenome]|uniref:Uncharacterized protein n=1 Tax=marine sediment metagenome TaxID=412755 RepID=X1TUZ9_9ZZZZ